MTIPQPIADAPRDGTQILAYGAYAWERLDAQAKKGWLVVYWDDELTTDEDGEWIGGWRSVTGNPYCDYMVAELWVAIPVLDG